MGCDMSANRRCPSDPNFARPGRTLFFLVFVQQGLRDKHQLSCAIRLAALPAALASEHPPPRSLKTSLGVANPNAPLRLSRCLLSPDACSLGGSTSLAQHCLDQHRSGRLRPLVSFNESARLSLRAVCQLLLPPQHPRGSAHWGSGQPPANQDQDHHSRDHADHPAKMTLPWGQIIGLWHPRSFGPSGHRPFFGRWLPSPRAGNHIRLDFGHIPPSPRFKAAPILPGIRLLRTSLRR